jgi:ATP-dependent RNA helicase DeaD
MTTDTLRPPGFARFDLLPAILDTLGELGHETPTDIQAAAIPELLDGRDVIAQAHTGTGKTAAFALPILSRLELDRAEPQALVLTPTRELTIQVADAFRRYGAGLPGLRVLPVYGGQEYGTQLRALRAGSHVVVGTPGRAIDHLRRGRLSLEGLRTLVLDEADEMLAMGFVDDIEWILEHAPADRQTTLFSATMPEPIRRIAARHLETPRSVSVRQRTATAVTIRQRYWLAKGFHKLDALSRILETEPTDGVLVFVRTKAATADLSRALTQRGFDCAPLSGDVEQKTREETIDRLRRGDLDIIVATDVAARGLDVDRIDHVINYDMPGNAEAYVHRIGRTGRAGRAGDAILFVSQRETRMLRIIERATNQRIAPMELPPVDEVNERRSSRFVERIGKTLERADLEPFRSIVERFQKENPDATTLDIAAALARMAHGDRPLFLSGDPRTPLTPPRRSGRPSSRSRAATPASSPGAAHASSARKTPPSVPHARNGAPAVEFEPFRVEVGSAHGVEPRNLVGAITNEGKLERGFIGRIEVHEDHSTLEMAAGMPSHVLRALQRIWVLGRQLKMSRVGGDRVPKRYSTSKGIQPTRRGARAVARAGQDARRATRPVSGKAPSRRPRSSARRG